MKSSPQSSLYLFFKTEWNLKLLPQNPKALFKPNLLFAGKVHSFNLICYQKNSSLCPTSAQLRALIQTSPDTVLVFSHDNPDFIDIYAQSAFDIKPVIVHDLAWKNNREFKTLANNDSFIEFSFELDKKFGKKRLERKFVSSFKHFTAKLSKAWINIKNDSAETRNALALHTLIRLFFVAFLQSRGTLDNRKHFIHEEALKCELRHASIYREFIQPLFFETLNCKAAFRTQRAKALGNIPFLNGGLFTPTQTENSSPQLDVSNTLLLDIISSLFEQYSLSASPDNDKLDPILDPMMLGHVFESLMAQNKRTITGSYYTPMPLARQIAADTLSQWLIHEFNISESQASEMCIQNKFDNIAPKKAAQMNKRLSEITILDPAVGSGAFLQCIFALLHQLRKGLISRSGKTCHSGLLAKAILANNLYGVDIVPTAGQLCELRLWLELIHYFSKDETLPPLPNLDLNIQCGNTLTDSSQYAKILGISANSKEDRTSIAKLKQKYKTSTGQTKKKLANKIQAQMMESGQKLFKTLIEACDRECLFLEQPQKTLFEKSYFSTSQRHRLNLLKEQRVKLQTCIDNHMFPGFSFDLHFSDILANGGFDIVIGNPPWYSIHTMTEENQKILRILYKTAVPKPGTKSQSSDISSLFVEKAIQCTRQNGFISMLVPNKLFRAPSYANFRNYISTHTSIVKTKDWSNEKLNTFAAAAYPASILLKKSNTQKGMINFAETEPESTLLDKVKIRIGDHYAVKRGICTGANEIFLAPYDINNMQDELKFKCSEHTIPIDSEIIHPILRGANINSYHADSKECMIFTHQWQTPSRPLTVLPQKTSTWLSHHSSRLAARKGIGKRPIHALFGCSDTLRSMKVVWKDISRDLEACFIKDPWILPLNTVYYIPVTTEDEGYLLTAWLNSKMARQFCRSKAEYAQNNYRRYFAWVIENLPIFVYAKIEENFSCIQKIIALSRQCHQMPSINIRSIQNEIDSHLDHCLNTYLRTKPYVKQPNTLPFDKLHA